MRFCIELMLIIIFLFAVCCGSHDLVLTQTRGDYINWKRAEYTLNIVNVGSSPVEQIHVHCGEFNPETALNFSSDVMRKGEIPGDCLILNGWPLNPQWHVTVKYINNYMYEMYVMAYSCHD